MKKRKKNINLLSSKGRNDFYKTPEWRNTREIVLREEIYCRECLKKGIYKIATEVDHIIDIKKDPSKALDRNNLQALCKECHSKKTFNSNISFQHIKYEGVNKKWKIYKI